MTPAFSSSVGNREFMRFLSLDLLIPNLKVDRLSLPSAGAWGFPPTIEHFIPIVRSGLDAGEMTNTNSGQTLPGQFPSNRQAITCTSTASFDKPEVYRLTHSRITAAASYMSTIWSSAHRSSRHRVKYQIREFFGSRSDGYMQQAYFLPFHITARTASMIKDCVANGERSSAASNWSKKPAPSC